MAGIAMHAPGEAESIAHLCSHVHRRRVELPAGIGDMLDTRSQPRFQFLLRSHHFVLDTIDTFPRHQDVASGMGSDGKAGLMDCADLFPGERSELREALLWNLIFRFERANHLLN